jgi:hypothetical protein
VFLDASDLCGTIDDAIAFAEQLRAEILAYVPSGNEAGSVLNSSGSSSATSHWLVPAPIHSRTQCTASVGIGPNIMLARIATRTAKPNGVHSVLGANARELLADMPAGDLPGVGWSISQKLRERGVDTCGQLQVRLLRHSGVGWGIRHGDVIVWLSMATCSCAPFRGVSS